ncbi:MAG: hypothetical protein LDLANPLL_02572 [Turneriella sp.]|nr:hypothetical protein [Turneriella sp.]
MRIKFFLLCVVGFCGCAGPNIGDAWPNKQLNAGCALAGCLPPVTVETPQIVLPREGYRTTSPSIRIQLGNDNLADTREVVFSQSGAAIHQISIDAGQNVVALPAGTLGAVSVKARLIYQGVTGAYSTPVNFNIEDSATATTLLNHDYSTMNGCGDNTVLFTLNGQGRCGDPWPTPGWSGVCPFVTGGGGNVWVCNNMDYLGTNKSGGPETHAANTANFGGQNAPDVSITLSSYFSTTLASDDGMGVACREKIDGNNNHYALWVFPYAAASISDNARIVRHTSAGTQVVLATAKVPFLENKGNSAVNPLHWRFDCLGTSLTGYYKDGSAYIPFIDVLDDSLVYDANNSYAAIGVGPTSLDLHHRVTKFELKRF